jgi:hypothetical protein
MNIPLPCQPGDPCYGKYLIAPGGPGYCIYTKSDDVIYIGTNLPNTGIKTGDCLTLALKKVDAAITTISQPIVVKYIADGVISDPNAMNISLFQVSDIGPNIPNIAYSAYIYDCANIGFNGDYASTVTTLTFPELTVLNGGQITSNSLVTINFPNVLRILPNQHIDSGSQIYISGNNLTNINFPLLQEIQLQLYIQATSAVSLSFPSFIRASLFFDINISSHPYLTTLTFSSGIKQISTYLSLYQNAFSETTVNYILAMLVSLDGTNGTTLWGGPTCLLNMSYGTSAAPTGQGILDVATLVARGATIITN